MLIWNVFLLHPPLSNSVTAISLFRLGRRGALHKPESICMRQQWEQSSGRRAIMERCHEVCGQVKTDSFRTAVSAHNPEMLEISGTCDTIHISFPSLGEQRANK